MNLALDLTFSTFFWLSLWFGFWSNNQSRIQSDFHIKKYLKTRTTKTKQKTRIIASVLKTRSKHIKGSKELCLLEQSTACNFLMVIPLIKLDVRLNHLYACGWAVLFFCPVLGRMLNILCPNLLCVWIISKGHFSRQTRKWPLSFLSPHRRTRIHSFRLVCG